MIKKMGKSKELGKFIVLQDAYGNRYTYSQLGQISQIHPVPRQRKLDAAALQARGPEQGRGPEGPGNRGRQLRRAASRPPKGRPAPQPRQQGPRTPREPRSGSSPSRERRQRRPRLLRGEDHLPGKPLPCSARPRPAIPTRPVRPQDDAAEAAQGRLPRHRRLGDRAGRQAPHRPAAAQLRDPARRPRRARRSTRSRSSTAGSCSRRPRSTERATRTRSARTQPSARSCSSRRRR